MWGTFNIRDYYSPKIDKQIPAKHLVITYTKKSDAYC